ncbi:MAG TPA: hypothetical protein VGL55_04020 [Steroidobacteraceae bacterium]
MFEPLSGLLNRLCAIGVPDLGLGAKCAIASASECWPSPEPSALLRLRDLRSKLIERYADLLRHGILDGDLLDKVSQHGDDLLRHRDQLVRRPWCERILRERARLRAEPMLIRLAAKRIRLLTEPSRSDLVAEWHVTAIACRRTERPHSKWGLRKLAGPELRLTRRRQELSGKLRQPPGLRKLPRLRKLREV